MQWWLQSLQCCRGETQSFQMESVQTINVTVHTRRVMHIKMNSNSLFSNEFCSLQIPWESVWWSWWSFLINESSLFKYIKRQIIEMLKRSHWRFPLKAILPFFTNFIDLPIFSKKRRIQAFLCGRLRELSITLRHHCEIQNKEPKDVSNVKMEQF